MDYVLIGCRNFRYLDLTNGLGASRWHEYLSDAQRFTKEDAKGYEANHRGLGDVLAIPETLAANYCYNNNLSALRAKIAKFENTQSASHLKPPYVLFVHTSFRSGYMNKEKSHVTLDLYVSYVYHTLEDAEADASKYASLKPIIVPVDKAPQNAANFDPASLLPEPPLPPGAIDYFAMIRDLCGK